MRLVDRMASTRKERKEKRRKAALEAWIARGFKLAQAERVLKTAIEKKSRRRAAALKAWDTRRENERQWLLGLLPPGTMKKQKQKQKPHRIYNTTTRRIVLED